MIHPVPDNNDDSAPSSFPNSCQALSETSSNSSQISTPNDTDHQSATYCHIDSDGITLGYAFEMMLASSQHSAEDIDAKTIFSVNSIWVDKSTLVKSV